VGERCSVLRFAWNLKFTQNQRIFRLDPNPARFKIHLEFIGGLNFSFGKLLEKRTLQGKVGRFDFLIASAQKFPLANAQTHRRTDLEKE
jgi:hypothetical protein